jgi:peptide-methionine (S)-S-oxide reductase
MRISIMAMQTATFGAGCFWGVEARFRARDGVLEATSGYMGGHKTEPSYREVCTGDTGHAEVVEVRFDDEQVSYPELLDLFFEIHDPTQHNRQGPDIGSQYRSVIFTYDDEQAAQARERISLLEREGRFERPIVTAVESAGDFWRAEEYHQRYLEKNGLGLCPI